MASRAVSVSCLRKGIRAIALKNEAGFDHNFSNLLCQVDISPDEDRYEVEKFFQEREAANRGDT